MYGRVINLISILLVFSHTAYSHSYLSLHQALDVAYQNNPDLKIENDKAEAQKGAFIQSGLYPNPALFLLADNLGGTGFNASETTLSLTQPIPLGNRLEYAKRATGLEYKAQYAFIKAQKAALYVRVGMAYIDAYYTQEWYQVTQKLTRLQSKIVSEMKRRALAGRGPELDLKLAEIRLGETQIQERQALRDQNISKQKLARAIGQDISSSTQLTHQGFSEKKWSLATLLKKMGDTPLIKAKIIAVQAKRAAISYAHKSIWPDLNIQLGGKHFSDDKTNAAVLSAMANVPTTNRNQGNIKIAHAQYTQALHELKSLKLDLKQNLTILFHQAEQSYYEADLITKTLLPLAREGVKVAEEGYKQGRYTYIELSLALQTLYDKERFYQQTHNDYHKAQLQIAGLLGEFYQGK